MRATVSLVAPSSGWLVVRANENYRRRARERRVPCVDILEALAVALGA